MIDDRVRAATFPHLFSPLEIGGVRLRNRIFSAGHDTTLPTDGTVNDALIAYQAGRAEGGVGLIIVQVAGVHETARYTSHLLMATDDDCIAATAARRCLPCRGRGRLRPALPSGPRDHGTADGTAPVAYAPSAVPDRALPRHAARAAGRDDRGDHRGLWRGGRAACKAAGLDGVEIVGQPRLPAGAVPQSAHQPARGRVWRQTPENRLRFLREVCRRPCARRGPGFVVGMRISGDEMSSTASTRTRCSRPARRSTPRLDYFNVIGGHLGLARRSRAHRAADGDRRTPTWRRFAAHASRPSASPCSWPAASTSRRTPSGCSPRARPTCAA